MTARVLVVLAVSEHFAALTVDGGHPGRGTTNWEMTQWRGLLEGAAAWPEIVGAEPAAAMATKYLGAFLDSGVYPDGVENEMASGCECTCTCLLWLAKDDGGGAQEACGMALLTPSRAVADDGGTAGDYYGSLVVIKQANMSPPPQSYHDRVEQMYNYLAYAMSPLGCLPQNGDSDICASSYSTDVARFFQRPDWDYVATRGRYGIHPSGPDHQTPSVMFPWAGQAVLRSGYNDSSWWMWFDVGPFGSNPFHAHMDKLSLQLQAFGSFLLMDSGRFAYSGNSFSHARRPYGRTTHGHNTLRIDGKEQQQAPALATQPRPAATWSFTPDHDVVQGSMALWTGLHNATHMRTVHHERGQWFVVVDVIRSGHTGSAVQATWHCHPNATVSIGPANVATVGGVYFNDDDQPVKSAARVTIVPARGMANAWASSKVVSGQLAGKDGATEDQGWYSQGYADASPAPVVVYDATLGTDQTQGVFAWLLLPSPGPLMSGAGPDLAVTAVNATAVEVTVTVDSHTSTITVPYGTA